MKKLIFLLLGIAGGLIAYRRMQAARAEEDLWIEATSSDPAGS
jgi:hypothetical protein